uniref:Uncharacterized protein n=1 Tax=Glossina palpalis gambiensis TaxID=67801 RepID=A0A1B0B0H1_9MUSC
MFGLQRGIHWNSPRKILYLIHYYQLKYVGELYLSGALLKITYVQRAPNNIEKLIVHLLNFAIYMQLMSNVDFPSLRFRSIRSSER